MTLRKKRATIAGLGLLAVAIASGVYAFLPGSASIRIHVETIRDEDGHYHQRWTFTGGRWESFGQGFTNADHFVVLDPPGVRDPASVRTIKGLLGVGASRIVYEVEARRVLPAESNGRQLVSVRRTLVGNATGGTPRFSTTMIVPLDDAPWSSRFRTIQADDAIVSFPSKIKLGDFGGSIETIEFR